MTLSKPKSPTAAASEADIAPIGRAAFECLADEWEVETAPLSPRRCD